MQIEDIDKDATFGVIGVCGINGNLISRVLMDHGFKVQANDMVNEEDCRFRGALADYPDMKVYYGKIPQTFFTESDYMVLPMALIESKSMIYQKVKKHNIPVLTPNDIFEMFEPKHPVICITGTNGKSTTTNLLKHIAYAADMKPCEHNLKDMQGNANDIPALQSRLAGDLNVLETGTFGIKGSLHALAKPCHPDVGIVTNITPDHIADGSTFLDYAMVKGELIELLRNKTLIINSDDPTLKSLVEKLDYDGNLITFGVDYETTSKSTKQCLCGCDVEVDEFISGCGKYECSCGVKYEKPDYVACDINDEHNKFSLLTPSGEKLEFNLTISGLHNIYNATGAIIAAIEVLDLDYETIADAVFSFGGVAGRMQKLGVVDGKDIMVDYAHNPAGISTVLSEVKNSYNCVVNVITTESESGMEGDHEILENALEYADFIVPASYNSYICAKEALNSGIDEGKIILPDEMSNFQKEGTTGASQHQVIVGFIRALDIDCDLIICTGEAAFKYEDVISDKINSLNNN